MGQRVSGFLRDNVLDRFPQRALERGFWLDFPLDGDPFDLPPNLSTRTRLHLHFANAYSLSRSNTMLVNHVGHDQGDVHPAAVDESEYDLIGEAEPLRREPGGGLQRYLFQFVSPEAQIFSVASAVILIGVAVVSIGIAHWVVSSGG
jgi:hypothetical protein